MNKTDLCNLAIKYGTDKGPAPEAHSRGHNYTPIYHNLFKYLFRYKKDTRLLELGIGGYNNPRAGGESLRMWSDYFSSSIIVGVDIEPKELDIPGNVFMEQGSQVDEDFLDSLVHKYGKFDIIVDDGSHLTEHHVKSFTKLFIDALKPGGIYIIEDLATSYEDSLKGHFGSSIDYFKQFHDLVNSRHLKGSNNNIYRYNELRDMLLSMTCYEELLVFIKRGEIS